VLIGSLVTFAVAWAASLLFAPAPQSRRDELSPGGMIEELLPTAKTEATK
jgi:hypothetical protein